MRTTALLVILLLVGPAYADTAATIRGLYAKLRATAKAERLQDKVAEWKRELARWQRASGAAVRPRDRDLANQNAIKAAKGLSEATNERDRFIHRGVWEQLTPAQRKDAADVAPELVAAIDRFRRDDLSVELGSVLGEAIRVVALFERRDLMDRAQAAQAALDAGAADAEKNARQLIAELRKRAAHGQRWHGYLRTMAGLSHALGKFDPELVKRIPGAAAALAEAKRALAESERAYEADDLENAQALLEQVRRAGKKCAQALAAIKKATAARLAYEKTCAAFPASEYEGFAREPSGKEASARTAAVEAMDGGDYDRAVALYAEAEGRRKAAYTLGLAESAISLSTTGRYLLAFAKFQKLRKIAPKHTVFAEGWAGAFLKAAVHAPEFWMELAEANAKHDTVALWKAWIEADTATLAAQLELDGVTHRVRKAYRAFRDCREDWWIRGRLGATYAAADDAAGLKRLRDDVIRAAKRTRSDVDHDHLLLSFHAGVAEVSPDEARRALGAFRTDAFRAACTGAVAFGEARLGRKTAADTLGAALRLIDAAPARNLKPEEDQAFRAVALTWIAFAALEAGDDEKAAQAVKRAKQLAARGRVHHNQWMLSYVATAEAALRGAAGDVAGAKRAIGTAEAFQRPHGYRWAAYFLMRRGHIALVRDWMIGATKEQAMQFAEASRFLEGAAAGLVARRR